MDLTADLRGDILVIHANEDRLDASSAIQFKDRMRELTLTASQRVVLDLSRVVFVDSSGLGAIVAVLKALAPDRKLELAGLTHTVQKVFRLTRMEQVFAIHAELPQNLRHAS
jgi:anti-sigma B factor antagonist